MLSATAIAAEAVAWLALPVGLVLLTIGLARREWSRQYRSVTAVVAAVDGTVATVRWFSDGGAVHEASAVLDDATPQVGDARGIWVHPSRPESMRLDDPGHDGRVLATIGGILTLVGVVGALLSFVLPLL